MVKNRATARRIAADALFSALGLITFLIENLFPPLFIPGAKMGLSNIFSLSALVLYGPVDAFAVIVVRTVLGSLFAGNVAALMYSFTGGVTAMAVSATMLYILYPHVSIMAVSIVAAVAHNIVQNLVFVAVSQTELVFSYMPYLALIGILSGTVVGLAVMLIFKRVPLSVYERALGEKTKNLSATEQKGDTDGEN